MKICNKCKIEKELGCFYKNNQQTDGRSGTCDVCTRLFRKKYDAKYNKTEKAKANGRRYASSIKGRKNKKDYAKAYAVREGRDWEKERKQRKRYERLPKYKARRKKYDATEKGRKAKKEGDRRYFSSAKGKFTKAKIELKRKFQKNNTECSLTYFQWLGIKRAFGGRCAYCKMRYEKLEKDHVKPLSRGGDHTAQNVVPACRSCNAKKGNRIQTHPFPLRKTKAEA